MKKKLLSLIFITTLLTNTSIAMASTYKEGISDNTGVNPKISIEDIKELEKETNVKENQIKKERSTRAYPSSKINSIGNRIQYNSVSCGPTTLYNIIYGYDVANYGRYCTVDKNGNLLTPVSYQEYVGFTANGTPFGSKLVSALNRFVPNNNYVLKSGFGSESEWNNYVKDSVLWTINKNNGKEKKNYSVMVNQYKTSKANGINSIYNGVTSMHYLAVYGYKDNGNTVYVSDTNPKLNTSNNKYSAQTKILSRDCKNRGIIW